MTPQRPNIQQPLVEIFLVFDIALLVQAAGLQALLFLWIKVPSA